MEAFLKDENGNTAVIRPKAVKRSQIRDTPQPMMKIYEYKTCSTCVKALKYLDARGIAYEKFPIVEQPPSEKELQTMLKHLKHDGLTFKNLFNTSGVQYRELGISDKIKDGLTEAEAIKMLSTNGKLIKRPFVLTDAGGTVGFKEEKFAKLLK